MERCARRVFAAVFRDKLRAPSYLGNQPEKSNGGIGGN